MLDQIEPLEKTIQYWLTYYKDRIKLEACPICKTKGSFKRLEELQPLSDCRQVECLNCGFITYNPQPKELLNFYVDNHRPQTVGFIKSKEMKLMKHKNLLFKFLTQHNYNLTSMLDYGCSDGYLLKEFAEYNKKRYKSEDTKLLGIELNKGHLNWAKYIENLNVTNNTDLSEIKDKYDIAVLYHVLEHVQDPEKLVLDLKAKLTTTGFLYVACPTLDKTTYSHLDLKTGPGINVFFKDEHINIFSAHLLEKFIANLGFRKVFEDKDLYGTCFIFQNNITPVAPKPYIKEDYLITKDLYNRLVSIYQIKEEFEKLVIKDKNQALALVKKGIFQIYPMFPELVAKAGSLMDHLDKEDFFNKLEKKCNCTMFELECDLAMTYAKVEDYELAEKHILKLRAKYGHVDFLESHLVYILYKTNRIPEFITEYKKLMANDPFDAQKINILGKLLLNI